MRSREDIQSYIDRAGLSFRELDESTWVLRASTGEENLVIQIASPLLLFRVKVMELAGVADERGLFRKLLELNASDLVHSAYGLSNGAVVISAALILETLDYAEFQGVADDLSLALANHYDVLAPFRPTG